jgi:hypothetical protein
MPTSRARQREADMPAVPECLDQREDVWRRSARQLRANAAACGTDDSGTHDRCTHHEHGLADNRGLCRGTGSATQVHAQVAMPIIVPTVGQVVCGIGTQRYDQREGRNECDQAIVEKTRAQEGASHFSKDLQA